MQIYEIGTHEGRPFLALEYVEGGSLKECLAQSPAAPAAAVRITELLARAVHYAHTQGIVHRDLKPANVLLQLSDSRLPMATQAGADTRLTTCDLQVALPKIADFGIAKHLDHDSGATLEGTVLGTPAYMSPEQGRADLRLVGPATDIYSLGAILYEMLAGRVPFEGATPLETLALVQRQDPVLPRQLRPSVPRDLETICLKCLHKDPRRRYASALALAEDVGRFRAGEPIQARPIGAAERLIKWARRRPALAGAAGVVVFLVLLAFALMSWGWSEAQERAGAEADARLRIAGQKRQVEALTANVFLDQGIHLCDSGEVGQGLLLLARAAAVAHNLEEKHLEEAARLNLAAWRSHYFRRCGADAQALGPGRGLFPRWSYGAHRQPRPDDRPLGHRQRCAARCTPGGAGRCAGNRV